MFRDLFREGLVSSSIRAPNHVFQAIEMASADEYVSENRTYRG